MFTKLMNTIETIRNTVSNALNRFRAWFEAKLNELLIKLAIRQAKLTIAKTTRQVALVTIPVINFGLTLSASYYLFDAMILLDYIMWGYVASAYVGLFWSLFWQSLGIVGLIFILMLALNRLWFYCYTHVSTRNRLAMA